MVHLQSQKYSQNYPQLSREGDCSVNDLFICQKKCKIGDKNQGKVRDSVTRIGKFSLTKFLTKVAKIYGNFLGF